MYIDWESSDDSVISTYTRILMSRTQVKIYLHLFDKSIIKTSLKCINAFKSSLKSLHKYNLHTFDNEILNFDRH